MTEQTDGQYFAGRESAERMMSRRANNPRAAAAHRELAARYEALAIVFGAKSAAQTGVSPAPAESSIEKKSGAPAPRDRAASEQGNGHEIAELEQLNAELTRSLNRCRKLLFDCRSQLAANCNMPELLDDGERARP